ncbi:MAG: putative diguanylate cyclase [Methanoregulaceae archaeon PtaU1.Bin066]|nr:MAG: putative diguanylate cyclase [Methanoregulaceae archaeon PtaU1.Bin066]
MWKHRIPAILEQKNFWTVILVISTFFAFVLNFYSLERDLTVVTPHLFYIPIVIAAYWFPRRGVIYTVAIAMGYLAMAYIEGYPDIEILTQSTARFYVFVAIGVIVASLSNNLKEQEDRYHGIFDYSEAGFFLAMNLRHGFVIEEVNERGANLLGYRARELVGRTLLDFFVEKQEKALIQEKVSPGGAVTEFECHLKRKDGYVIHGLMSAGPLPGRKVVFTLVDITGMKKAEEELRESKERYQGLYTNAQVGLARASVTDGRILEANDQMANMFGYSSVDEFIREFRFPEHYADKGVREQLFATLADNDTISNFEARFFRKDGSILWARFWARIFPEKGYLEEVFTDITEEKLSHRALDESEERYRKLVESLPDYVLVFANDRILFVNPSAANTMGKTPDEMVSHPIYDYLSPESVETIRTHSKKRVAGGHVNPYEIDLSLNDGRSRTVLADATPITYRNQDAILAVLTDITDRKRADEKLKASKDQYMATIDAMVDGIFLVNQDLEIVLVNSSFRRWLERIGRHHEVVGMNAGDALPCVGDPGLKAIKNVFSTGKILETTVDFHLNGRGYFFENRHIPVFEEKHVARVMTIMRDITRSRMIEEEKRLAYEQIEKNIEQFAILGDHLRNPMQVIVGLADLEGGPLAEQIHRQTEEIDRTVSQLDRGWIESEKIREFIRKYYGIGK